MATTDLRLSIAQQTGFALRLAVALFSPSSSASGAGAGNTAFSPLSFHVALSLVAASAGGTTRDQLASALKDVGPGAAEGLHALAEQVVQLVLADASGAGDPCIVFNNKIHGSNQRLKCLPLEKICRKLQKCLKKIKKTLKCLLPHVFVAV